MTSMTPSTPDTTTPPPAEHPSRPTRGMATPVVVEVALLHPHPANVREELGELGELAASITAHGVVQPLVVQPHPARRGHYRVLAGHRRLQAARKAGRDSVPVLIRHGVTDAQALELMLVENCQRRELGPMEKAEAMEALRHRGYTASDIARTTGLASSTVSYYLALLELDGASRAKVTAGELSAAEAVTAVRRARKKARAKAGSAAEYAWEPDYLAATHPLARKARWLCDAREHTLRRRIGKTACGQCWEAVIRDDERVVIGAMADEVASLPTGPDRRTEAVAR